MAAWSFHNRCHHKGRSGVYILKMRKLLLLWILARQLILIAVDWSESRQEAIMVCHKANWFIIACLRLRAPHFLLKQLRILHTLFTHPLGIKCRIVRITIHLSFSRKVVRVKYIDLTNLTKFIISDGFDLLLSIWIFSAIQISLGLYLEIILILKQQHSWPQAFSLFREQGILLLFKLVEI